MAARAALFSLLKGTASLGFEEVYPTNSIDTAPEEFFAVINWGLTSPAFGTTGIDRVQIWVHDKSRDYGRINAALEQLKNLLPTVNHRPGEDGIVLSAMEWDGESQDLFDSGMGTVTRYADFTAVSRYASV